MPALLLELSKHRETIQGNQGHGAASIVWTENATGIQRGELKVAAKNRQQFQASHFKTHKGEAEGAWGQPSRAHHAGPAVEDTVQVSSHICQRQEIDDEVPILNRNMPERFELKLSREENSAPIFTF